MQSAGRGLTILSAEGNELRRFREDASGSYTRHGRDLQAYSPALIEAVLRAEDRRFYYHPGFDPAAVLRAALQNLQAGRIVSGGSTITQQLVRLLYRTELPRNAYLRKIAELLLALRLELHAGKDEILLAYLNRVPLPGNRSGIAAGSEYLFGRDPRFLTREESLALAILIRHNYPGPESFQRRYRRLAALLPESSDDAPSANISRAGESRTNANPDARGPEAPDDLVNRIFARTATREIREPRGETTTPASPSRTPGHSPHFTDWLRGQFPDIKGVVRTRLSENENESIQNILHGELEALAKLNARHAAVVVLRIDRDAGRLILEGLVGSRDYDDPSGGQINGATTRRVAGSTLKPFIYGLAFEEQSLRPYSIVYDDDSNVSLGAGATYRPRNYDLNYWGAMTAREALATSRNIPAVKLTESLGEERVFEFLGRAGFFPIPAGASGQTVSSTGADLSRIEADPYAFGPGIALGISGATLLDLARAYSAFAADGEQYPVLIGEREDGRDLLYGATDRLFSEQTAHRITHILSDRSMRRRAFGERSFLDFPFDVAAKTGTSKDYRDAWTVGYSRRYVVAVWVGNFNATPMKNVSGAHGAGRIFHQVMRGLHRQRKPRFQYPEDWRRVAICRHTGLAAADSCEHFSELIPAEEVTPVQCHGEHHSDSLVSRGADSFANRSADSFTSIDATNPAYDANSSDAQNPATGGRRHLLSPTPGAVYYLDPHAPRKIQEIPLRLHQPGRASGLQLELPGQAAGPPRSCRPPACLPTLALDPGEYEIRVLREGREIERIEFSVR